MYPNSANVLTMGFITFALGSSNAFILFNHLLGVPDCRLTNIQCWVDGSYRRIDSNGQQSLPLDYYHDQKGTIILQEMWRPAQLGGIQRHFVNARMQWPIFFLSKIIVDGYPSGFFVGIDLSLAGRASLRHIMIDPELASSLGGRTTTHFCLKWRGYPEYKKQVEIQNSQRQSISMLRLFERIARFVEKWIEDIVEGGIAIDPLQAVWRVGPGFITKNDLYVVGLVHVSAGTWQPILQFKGLILY